MSVYDIFVIGSVVSNELECLLVIMVWLCDLQGGCLWDLEQNFVIIVFYIIEEVYEVVDVIDRGDLDDFCDEFGDLLLQVVFYVCMVEEQGVFVFVEVVCVISDKMQCCYLYVFVDVSVDDVDGVMCNWEVIKCIECVVKGEQDIFVLVGILCGLLEWQWVVKLQLCVVKVGFDWLGLLLVLDKVVEELQELCEEFECGDVVGNKVCLQEELGDLLFVCVNLVCYVDIDLGVVLCGVNYKFECCFCVMEVQVDVQGEVLVVLDLDVQEVLWQQVKVVEKV